MDTGDIQDDVQGIFKECEPWMRLAIGVNIHIKEALIDVVHNNINDPHVTLIPSDPAALYAFLQTKKKEIKNSFFIKTHQKSILLPTNSQSVDSSFFDISITRFLIQSFCGIVNAKGDWFKPDQNDKTLCAYVYRAAEMRNSFAHDNNIKGLSATEFETKWKELEEILKGLKYDVNKVKPIKNGPFDWRKYRQVVLLEEFVDHLCSYKEECTKEKTQDYYALRRFSDGRNKGNIVTESDSESTSEDNDEKDIVTESDLENLIKDNDRLLIYGEAGLGKTSMARRLKSEWFNEKILNGHHLIYYDSKKMGKQVKVKSFAAPLYFSELGDYLRKKGRTEDDLSIYKCVRTTIDDLVIIIDGIDEFPIKELVNGNSIDELEKKIKSNEEITAAETIIAIYFGFLFPFSKIILLGRIGEFGHLKEFNVKRNEGIFNRRNIDLKLLIFDDANVKDFTCNRICDQQQHGQICSEACEKIYKKIKNIELCKIPTDLNSLIELYKKNPNENIGRITRTKLIIATLKNRLINHININQRINYKFKSFHEISEQKDLSNYLECIRKMSEISFQILLKNNITVKVDEKEGQFIYKEIKVERKIFEELDFFYVRDLENNSILEPHHTIDIEFLSACYLFSNERDSILNLNKDRQLVIISFIAGLHADDNFTKDFVENVLNIPDYSLEQFFNWLYDVNVRESLPDGGRGYNRCWFGLMETQKLSPSLFLLDSISHEVEIPQIYIPKTIVCYCRDSSYDSLLSFEWYFMKYLKHNFLTRHSDKLNIESFLKKFRQYKFIIKGCIKIEDNDEFNLLNKFGNNDRITFRINRLYIDTSLSTSFSSHFNVNTLYIVCDLRTIDMILNALSPPTTNTSSSNSQPAIKCKRLRIPKISQLFNSQQREKLFELCLCGVVDYIALRFDFFTGRQLAILENAERKANKMLNIELYDAFFKFNEMFGLPNLGNRHVSLNNMIVKDNDLINLREHIIPTGYANNLTNFDRYKIIDPDVPFVRKENSSQDRKQLMFLNLYNVDFRVSPDVFAETFSLIPSLSCDDSERYGSYYIPSSYWSRLSQINNCRLNEMRIWEPRPENFKHFLNIKTNLLQLIFKSKDELKGLLNHIVNTTNIQLDKQIKVFVVRYDKSDWDYYIEVPVFSDKTIVEYRNNYRSDDLLLDNISVKFYEGELDLKWWCCEISLIKENIDSDDKMTSYCYKDFLVIDIPNQSDDQENIDSDDKMTSYCYEDFLVIDIPYQKDVDVNSPCDQI